MTVALAPRILPERRERSSAPLDVASAVPATAGLGALVLALTLAQSRGLAARDTFAALAAAAVLLGAFPFVVGRAEDPLLSASAQVGTVLGLAVLVPVAAARAAALQGGDAGELAGYELGFVLAAALAATAAVVVGLRARRGASRQLLPDARDPAGV